MGVNVFWAYLFVDNFAFHRASLSVTVRKSHFQLMNLNENVSFSLKLGKCFGSKMSRNWFEIWDFRKKIEYLTKRNKIQFSIDFFFSVRPHTEVLFILEIFLKRKRRNNYAFVQTLLYKIRTEFTNINFIQCRLSR